jgi:hypothetical protein
VVAVAVVVVVVLQATAKIGIITHKTSSIIASLTNNPLTIKASSKNLHDRHKVR